MRREAASFGPAAVGLYLVFLSCLSSRVYVVAAMGKTVCKQTERCVALHGVVFP